MAGLPPPPPGIDLTEDRGSIVTGISYMTWFIAVTVVGLRTLSRRMNHVRLGIDDWLIIAALGPSFGHTTVLGAYAVSRGFGKHIWAAPPDALFAWATYLFTAECCYTLTILLTKGSILTFFWRSFNIRKSIKVPIICLWVIACIWAVAVIMVTVFQCLPVYAFWERFNPTHPLDPSAYSCTINDRKFFYGNAIPTIVTDLAMLALPLPYILDLQLPKGHKFALAGIFLVGLFVSVVSIIRLHYLLLYNLEDPDVTFDFVNISIWSVCEGNTAIFCACLPFLRPVLGKISFSMLNLSSSSTGRNKQSNGPSKGTNTDQNTSEGDGKYGTSTTHVKALGRTAAGEADESPFVYLADEGVSDQSLSMQKGELVEIELENGRASPMDCIVVTKQVRVQHQTVKMQ